MATTMTPTFSIQRSGERYHAQHGWLDARHSFSFADYYDPENVNWGALRVFNDDRIAGGTGFPPHPHRDMEIVTYVFSGELAHKDSMGNAGVVGPGGVQFMSAGTGVRHSEFNNKPDEQLHLAQMWVMPGKVGTPPTYGQLDFTRDDRLNRWLTIVSGEPAVEAPIRITQRATFKVSLLENGELLHEFAPKRYGFLFVADGSVEANGERLQTGDAARLYDVATLSIKGSGEILLWDLPDA
jgi:quercetin 2,3-dioxygenase